ncbi:hypothetical protein AB5I41_05370 [Sphingomonas sp. MMS24-JH45]
MRLRKSLHRRIVDAASPRMRARRVARFLERIRPTAGMRVVDLGGMPSFWRFCPVPLDVTIVNLDVAQIDGRISATTASRSSRAMRPT